MAQTYDLLVIGAGMAGVAAANKCASQGWKVAIVDAQPCPASRMWQGFLGLKGGDRRVGDSQVHVQWPVPGQGFVWADRVVLDPVVLCVLGEHDGVVDLVDLVDVEPFVLQGPEPAFT